MDIKSLQTIVVGGNFGLQPKKSSIIQSIANILDCKCINGGSFDVIKNIDLSGYELIIWAPNIDNGYEKTYPQKDRGAILICSKVMRINRTEIDAIDRIFKMHANAVIAIRSQQKPFVFKLIDALGNCWSESTSLENLCHSIGQLVRWNKGSIRQKSYNISKKTFDYTHLQQFIDLNRLVADKFELTKARYFGNASTRCMKMFPSMKQNTTHIVVSRRNVDKKRITTDDLVLSYLDEAGDVAYYGPHKPSIDTAIQLNIYKAFPDINFMIHGHSYVQTAPFSSHYYPCGDLREVKTIVEMIQISPIYNRVINLKNHGFLILATNIEQLENICKNMVFEHRKAGFEAISSSLVNS